ncbi:MAG: hypothetical protein OHK0013_37790 [Sandaracinaceae bacterium]
MRTPEPALDRHLEAFSRVLFEPIPPEADLATLGPARRDRFLLYRELVRSRFREIVATALPRTTALVGRERMDALVEARVSESPPTSRFFREVVHGLIAPDDPRLPHEAHPHVGDLVRLELAQWRAVWDDPPELPAIEFDFARPPVVAPTLVRLDLAWSVHRADRPIEPGTFHVAVYRRRDGTTETRWMNRFLASILDAWMAAEEPAIDGVRSALAGLGAEPTPELVEQMSAMLAELLERGGVLGSRP